MSTLRNNVRLIGNVGQEPTITMLESGKKVARLSIATNEPYKDSKGKKKSNTDWHNLVAWGKMADVIELDVFKGMKLAIAGKLGTRHYGDNTGVKRYVTEISVSEILILEQLD